MNKSINSPLLLLLSFVLFDALGEIGIEDTGGKHQNKTDGYDHNPDDETGVDLRIHSPGVLKIDIIH
ncbi:MAG: hypothetical protein KGI25_09980, partial [Thaumarchaeota archaeon]|nr:hypothetical protein [Nitrososphaerota archaeon]